MTEPLNYVIGIHFFSFIYAIVTITIYLFCKFKIKLNFTHIKIIILSAFSVIMSYILIILGQFAIYGIPESDSTYYVPPIQEQITRNFTNIGFYLLIFIPITLVIYIVGWFYKSHKKS